MARMAGAAILGLLGFLLFCELLFRVLPVSSATKAGYYIDADIQTYAPHHPWRYSTGWDLRNPQYLSTNNYGFVSAHDFKRDESAIALVGDSYVESASLPADDRPAAQLERALGGRRPVYAMGAAGTALLDYAERIRFAHETFGIRDYVLMMERGDVRQSLCGSGNVHSRCLDPVTLDPRTERRPPASMAKQLLRSSSFAQYLVSQLKIEPAKLLQQAFMQRAPASIGSAPPRPMSDIDAVTRAFFERVKPHIAGRLVIVVDSNRPALMRSTPVSDPERDRFIELARTAGAIVVDTEPIYRSHFERSKLSLDIGPYDGHFNAIGVKLLAVSAAQAFSL